jgi:hypothetical protein
MAQKRCKLTYPTSSYLTASNEQTLRERIVQLERADNAVFLSLTRTSTLSITTAGVIVTWQSEIDNAGEITWSGSSITVPIAGYYLITVIGALSTKDEIHGDLRVNSVDVCSMGTGGHKDVKFMHSVCRFFAEGDVVQYRAHTTTSTHTLQATTEDSASESPIFHMVMI